MVEIITASEKDIPVIEEILLDTVRWLDSVGQPLWREDQIKWERLSKDFSAPDFLIAMLDGKPAACMAVVDYDPTFWPDIRKDSSLFIHKLAVKRFAAGKGLSDALIAHAKSMCMDRGIAVLRLDCHALIPKQRAVYERNGFICVGEKVLYGKYHTAFYKCEVNDTKHLYHYYDKSKPPLRAITSLSHDKAFEVLTKHSDMSPDFWDNWLNKRYADEKTVRDKFISIGGRPVNSAPVYFTLGANEGMKTWFDNLAWIKIPVSEFDLDAVSFAYGDSFAVFNPSLDTGEEWWGQVFRYKDMLRLIDRYGYPEDPPYDMKNRIFPNDRHIHLCLKYIEAHVWSDEILNKYR